MQKKIELTVCINVRMYLSSLSPWYFNIGPSATTITFTQLSFEIGGQVSDCLLTFELVM